MELHNNRYYKLDIELEELTKCKIINESGYKGKHIEDIDILVEEPNILIYTSNIRGYDSDSDEDLIPEEKEIKTINFYNIYPSVRILVTTYLELTEERYKEIPDFIEYIIIGKYIYRNTRNKFDFILFYEERDAKRYLYEMIEDRRFNEINSSQESLLYLCCYYKIPEIIDYIDEFTDEIINLQSKDNSYCLHECAKNKLYDLFLLLLPRSNDDIINDYNENKYSCLMQLCVNIEVCRYIEEEGDDEEKIELKKYLTQEYKKAIICGKELIKRTTIETINCYYNEYKLNIIYTIVKKDIRELLNAILEKTKIESINVINVRSKNSILYYACENNLENLAIILLFDINKDLIKFKNSAGKSPYDIAIEKNFSKLVIAMDIALEETNKEILMKKIDDLYNKE